MRLATPILGLAVISLGGCAVNVPSMGRVGEAPQARELREAELVNHIKCELHLAVQRIQDEAARNDGPHGGNSLAWLETWGAKVSLQMQVNVKSTVSPGLSVTDILENVVKVFPANGDVTIGRNRALGFGATFASDVTRTETIGYFYKFSELSGEGRLSVPGPDGTPMTPIDTAFCGPIDIVDKDDLQIYDFLHSKIMLAVRPDALPQKANKSPFDALSFQVKFIVTQGATVNPSWKLVKVGINPAGNFFNGQRIKTNDLTITLGPITEDKDGKPEPSLSLNEQHLANLIGRAVSDAIRDPQ